MKRFLLFLLTLLVADLAVAEGTNDKDLVIKEKYTGRIITLDDFYRDTQFRPVFILQKTTVITNQAEYQRFTSRLPSMEPLDTKGEDHLNDDPLRKCPPVNFTNQIMVAVTRDNMYIPPKITRVFVSNNTVVVEYAEEDLGTMATSQQKEGLGTYYAVVVARTESPVIFRKGHPSGDPSGNGPNDLALAQLTNGMTMVQVQNILGDKGRPIPSQPMNRQMYQFLFVDLSVWVGYSWSREDQIYHLTDVRIRRGGKTTELLKASPEK